MAVIPRVGIEKIPPYVQGAKPTGGPSEGIKLSANESALGPSPLVGKAYETALKSIQWYPDSNGIAVREAIAERYQISFDKILLGVGSDELLKNLISAYSGIGDEVIFSTVTFPLYAVYTLGAGASPVRVPHKNYAFDIDAALDLVSSKTKIVVVANPNNPTGTYISAVEMRDFRKELPEHILLIIDAAYAEYVEHADYDSGIDLVEEYDNTLMTRTFSKIHGLASIRLGWCYGHKDILSVVGRIRSPFNVSGPAQAAGLAAVSDLDYQLQVIRHNKQWHRFAHDKLASLGLHSTGTEGNFICVGLPVDYEKTIDDIDAFLRGHNVFTRPMKTFGLQDHLRITIGRERDMRICMELMESFLTG